MRVMVRGKETERHVKTVVDGKVICLVERKIRKTALKGVEYWIWDKKRRIYVKGKAI